MHLPRRDNNSNRDREDNKEGEDKDNSREWGETHYHSLSTPNFH